MRRVGSSRSSGSSSDSEGRPSIAIVSRADYATTLRKQPTSSREPSAFVPGSQVRYNEAVRIVKPDRDGFTKVQASNGKRGYIKSEYLRTLNSPIPIMSESDADKYIRGAINGLTTWIEIFESHRRGRSIEKLHAYEGLESQAAFAQRVLERQDASRDTRALTDIITRARAQLAREEAAAANIAQEELLATDRALKEEGAGYVRILEELPYRIDRLRRLQPSTTSLRHSELAAFSRALGSSRSSANANAEWHRKLLALLGSWLGSGRGGSCEGNTYASMTKESTPSSTNPLREPLLSLEKARDEERRERSQRNADLGALAATLRDRGVKLKDLYIVKRLGGGIVDPTSEGRTSFKGTNAFVYHVQYRESRGNVHDLALKVLIRMKGPQRHDSRVMVDAPLENFNSETFLTTTRVPMSEEPQLERHVDGSANLCRVLHSFEDRPAGKRPALPDWAHDSVVMADSTICVLMPLLDGGDLQSLFEAENTRDIGLGGETLQQRARQAVRDVLLGVRHLKRHGVVHRDIKPDNILIKSMRGGGYTFILTDVGAALDFKSSSLGSAVFREANNVQDINPRAFSFRLTSKVWSWTGAPGIQAPEIMQACAKLDLPSRESLPAGGILFDYSKADEWACGLVFHRMLHRSDKDVPFPDIAEMGRARLRNAIDELYQPMELWQAAYNEQKMSSTVATATLREIVRRLLTINPAQRPSASELLDSKEWPSLRM